MLGDNQRISKSELDLIRRCCDFDLTMLISEIHDHGWPVARTLLPLISASNCKNKEPKQK